MEFNYKNTHNIEKVKLRMVFTVDLYCRYTVYLVLSYVLCMFSPCIFDLVYRLILYVILIYFLVP